MAGELFGAIGAATSRFFDKSQELRAEEENRRQFDETMKLNREQLAISQQQIKLQEQDATFRRFGQLEQNISNMDNIYAANVKYMSDSEKESFGKFIEDGRAAVMSYYATGDDTAYKEFAQNYQGKPFGVNEDGQPITLQSILGNIPRRKTSVDFNELVQGSSLQTMFTAAGQYITDPDATPDQKEWGKSIMKRLQNGETVDMAAEFSTLATLNGYTPSEILRKARSSNFSVDALWIADQMLQGSDPESWSSTDKKAAELIKRQIDELKQPQQDQDGNEIPSIWDEYVQSRGAAARQANLSNLKLASGVKVDQANIANINADTNYKITLNSGLAQDIKLKADRAPTEDAILKEDLISRQDQNKLAKLGYRITKEGWVLDKEDKRLKNLQLQQLIDQNRERFDYELAILNQQAISGELDNALKKLNYTITDKGWVLDEQRQRITNARLQLDLDAMGAKLPYEIRILAAEADQAETVTQYTGAQYTNFVRTGNLSYFKDVQDMLFGAVQDGRPDVLASPAGKEYWMQQNRSFYSSDEEAEQGYELDIAQAADRRKVLDDIRADAEQLTASKTRYDKATIDAAFAVFDKYGLTNMMTEAEVTSLKLGNDKQAALIYQTFLPKLLQAQYTGEIASVAADLANLPGGAGITFLDGLKDAGALTEQQARPFKSIAEMRSNLEKSGINLQMQLNSEQMDESKDNQTIALAQRPYLTILGQKGIFAEIGGKRVSIQEAENNLAVAIAIKDLLPKATRQELITKIASGQYEAALNNFKASRINWDAALQDTQFLISLANLDPSGSMLQFAPFADALNRMGGTRAYDLATQQAKINQELSREQARLALLQQERALNGSGVDGVDDMTPNQALNALKERRIAANQAVSLVADNPEFKQAVETIKNITKYDLVMDPVTGRSKVASALSAAKDPKVKKDLEEALAVFDQYKEQYVKAKAQFDQAVLDVNNFRATDRTTWGQGYGEADAAVSVTEDNIPTVTPSGSVGKGNVKLFNPYGNKRPTYRTAYNPQSSSGASGYTPDYIRKEINDSIAILLDKQKQTGGNWFDDRGPLRGYNGFGLNASETGWKNPGYVQSVKAAYDSKPWITAIDNAKGERKLEMQFINQTIEEKAKAAGIPANVLKALMWHESGGWKVGEYNGADGGIGQVNGYKPPAPQGYSWTTKPKAKTDTTKPTTTTKPNTTTTAKPTTQNNTTNNTGNRSTDQTTTKPNTTTTPNAPATTNKDLIGPPAPEQKPLDTSLRVTPTTTPKTQTTTPKATTPKTTPKATTPKPQSSAPYQYKGNIFVTKEGAVNQRQVDWILGDPRFKKLIDLVKSKPDDLSMKLPTGGTVGSEITEDIATRFLKDNGIEDPTRERVEGLAGEIMRMAGEVQPNQTRTPTRDLVSPSMKVRIGKINNDASFQKVKKDLMSITKWSEAEAEQYIEDYLMGRVK